MFCNNDLLKKIYGYKLKQKKLKIVNKIVLNTPVSENYWKTYIEKMEVILLNHMIKTRIPSEN